MRVGHDDGENRDDAFAATHVLLDVAETMTVGVDLVGACMELAAEPLDASAAVRLNRLLEHCMSWLSLTQMEIKAVAFDRVSSSSHAAADIVAELATSTRVSDLTAGSSLSVALGVRQLPFCREALATGELTVGHARALDRVLGSLDSALARQVDAIVSPMAVARGLTPHQTRKAAEQILLRMDPAGSDERAVVAKAQDSDVRFRTVGDGLGTLTATGDQVLLRQVADAIDDAVCSASQQAAHGADDGCDRSSSAVPSMGERRVLTLARLVLGDDQVQYPAVNVVVSLSLDTLLGLRDDRHPLRASDRSLPTSGESSPPMACGAGS